MSTHDREIERKYLLHALPPRVADASSVEIDQGYLPGTRINERIRRAVGPDGAHFYRTLKAGSGLSRIEIEEETDAAFFDAVWPLTSGARIHKRRYTVHEGARGDEWVVDEFLDRAGLFLAEIELEREDQLVSLPAWLAAVLEREVTDEPAYTNHALAR